MTSGERIEDVIASYEFARAIALGDGSPGLVRMFLAREHDRLADLLCAGDEPIAVDHHGHTYSAYETIHGTILTRDGQPDMLNYPEIPTKWP